MFEGPPRRRGEGKLRGYTKKYRMRKHRQDVRAGLAGLVQALNRSSSPLTPLVWEAHALRVKIQAQTEIYGGLVEEDGRDNSRLKRGGSKVRLANLLPEETRQALERKFARPRRESSK